MSHTDAIINAFRTHGGKMTLGELLEEGRYTFAHKLTARLSDLRKKGYQIDCVEGENPSKNLYVLHEPHIFESSGQGVLLEHRSTRVDY